MQQTTCRKQFLTNAGNKRSNHQERRQANRPGRMTMTASSSPQTEMQAILYPHRTHYQQRANSLSSLHPCEVSSVHPNLMCQYRWNPCSFARKGHVCRRTREPQVRSLQASFQARQYPGTMDVWTAKPQTQRHGMAEHPTSKQVVCSENHMSQTRDTELDHWMLPQATRIQKDAMQHLPQVSRLKSSSGRRKPGISSCTPHYKHTNVPSENRGAVHARAPEEKQIPEVGDPELEAALKPDRHLTTLGLSHRYTSQESSGHGLLIDPAQANGFKVQYSLGYGDSD
jgi:hypothetical protein